MKRLVYMLVFVALAALPVRAGASSHGGGFGGGGSHGFSASGYGGSHGYSGSSYGGHGYSGSGYGGHHGYYGGGYRSGYRGFYGGGYYGGYYGAYPYYGYGSYGDSSYGYAPYDDSYSMGYSSPPVYGSPYDTPVYPYAPQVAPPAPASPAPAATPSTAPTAATPTEPLATGKVDDLGVIHSPYTNATFKADKIAPGQIFYDPITGQPFTLAKPGASPATTPAPGPAPAPSTSMPAGKLDEFGYVHSPFSTFTFKVQNANYAQVFRDPFTGQTFTVRPRVASPTPVPSVAGPAGSAQASD